MFAMMLPRRHPLHWDELGDVIIRVSQTLYKLDSKMLKRHSAMFADMFAMPSGVGQTHLEGASEECPITLLQGEEPEFDLFVSQAYGLFIPQVTNTALLLNTLNLSHFLMAPAFRAFALHAIDGRKWHFDLCDLICICLEFNTKHFFIYAFERLLTIPLHELDYNRIAKITVPVFIAVAIYGSILDEYRHIVTAKPPIITSHALDCGDPVHCAEDWFAVWWNRMARMMLDGCNPLTYDEALTCFELMQFGDMSDTCKSTMLELVQEGEGFRCYYAYTKEYATSMADYLIKPDMLDLL